MRRKQPSKKYVKEYDVRQSSQDFLRSITNLFTYAKWIGIPVYGGKLAMYYAVAILLMFISMEACSVWKLVRVLTGMAIQVTAGHSFVGKLSGMLFYANSLISMILIWKFVGAWKRTSNYWLRSELSVGLDLPPDYTIKSRIKFVLRFIGICALVEHIMSMISAIGLNFCSIEECFQKYILQSHGFLLRPQDYSLWIAIPIFVLSKLATVLWNLQDIVIILLSIGVTSRYRILNVFTMNLVQRENEMNDFGEVYTPIRRNVYIWRRLRQAYGYHANLVRTLDSQLGNLILLSNMNNLYFICLQLYLGIKITYNSWISKLYYILSLVWLLFRACSVVLAGAEISLQSQRALPYLRSCRSSVFNIEIKRLINQLSHDNVSLNGLGLFSLSRQTLMGVVAVVLKYELILLQYDN